MTHPSRLSWASAFTLLLAALSLAWVIVIIRPQTYRPLMLVIAAWGIIRAFPSPGRYGPVRDVIWVVISLIGLGWPLAAGDPFLYRAANPTAVDLLCGVLAIAVVLEITRRTTGWILPAVSAGMLVYAAIGPWFASIGLTGIAHRGYDLSRLIGNLYMTLEGIYGVPLDVAVTYIILFSLYGAVLEVSGAGRFFLDFAMRWSSRGDPARAAGRSVTFAGFLLGTVSGSGVATTVTLGSVAWPILRRVGYAADTAGAMLAAAGIGALLSPPTLGAAAFLIAEYLRISYLQVLVMATIPTVLYYLSILVMIDAAATGSAGSAGSAGAGSSEESEPVAPVAPAEADARSLARYRHFSSLVLIAVLMVMGFTPFLAVFWATVAAVVLSWVGQRDERLGPKRLTFAFAEGGRDVLPVIATTAVAGVIVGVVTLTGLGLKAAGLIVGLAGGSLAMTVVFAALAVWMLGLAVPVTASYIISAVMVAPALTSVGVPLVAAHMFIFYYAVLSEVSPPTALAPFAAAALTGGRPFRTMVLTWKFVLPAFVVPFVFTLGPRGMALLMEGTALEIVEMAASAAGGVILVAIAIGRRPRSTDEALMQTLAGVAGALLLYPSRTLNLVGLIAGLAAWVWQRRTVRLAAA